MAVDGRRIGKRRKKKKGKSSLQGSSGVDTPVSGSGNEDEWEENTVGGAESSGADAGTAP